MIIPQFFPKVWRVWTIIIRLMCITGYFLCHSQRAFSAYTVYYNIIILFSFFSPLLCRLPLLCNYYAYDAIFIRASLSLSIPLSLFLLFKLSLSLSIAGSYISTRMAPMSNFDLPFSGVNWFRLTHVTHLFSPSPPYSAIPFYSLARNRQ